MSHHGAYTESRNYEKTVIESSAFNKTGEVDQERKDRLEQMMATFEKLHSNTTTLSDLLGVDMPEIAVPEDPDEKADGGGGADIEFNLPPPSEDDIWEDKDTKR